MRPSDLFSNLTGMWQDLFSDIELVFQVLEKLEPFTAALLQRHGNNAADVRKAHDGSFVKLTTVLHQGQVYTAGFTVLGGDPTKGKMKVVINGRQVLDATVVEAGAILKDDDIYLGPGVLVEAGALIKGPTFIDAHSEVRQGAYLRGGCLIGKSCVVGHTTEIKNSAMLDNAKAGHFAYLGDSILGQDVNLGAGTKLANLKFTNIPYKFTVGEEIYRCERKKFGAIMGDNCQTGCNSVTNPGVVMGQKCLVAPCCAVASGYYAPKSRVR